MKTNQTKPLGGSRLDACSRFIGVGRLMRDILSSRFSIQDLLLSLLLLLLALPRVVQAQEAYPFRYSVNNGAVTITGFSIFEQYCEAQIPSTIDWMPVTSIGYRAFWTYSLSEPQKGNIIYLTSAIIPSSVTNIEAEAFYESPWLTNVRIGSGVTSIGDKAFYGCWLLYNLYFEGNAPSLGGSSVFAGDNYAEVYYLPGTTGWGPTFGGRPTVLWTLENQLAYRTNNGAITITDYHGFGGEVILPDTIHGLPVTSIDGWAFSGCAELTSVVIPDSVTNIGVYAFASCGLTSVTIPSSVSRIGDYAFHGCDNLRAICFQGNAPSIGPSMFGNAQPTVYYLQGTTGWASTFGGQQTALWNPEQQYGYRITNNGITLMHYTGAGDDVIIPNTIDGLPVTTIGDFAFDGGTSLVSVTIPASVTTVGNYAFQNCVSLTAAYFRGNAPSADASVFQGDNNATVYYLPGTSGWGPTFGGRRTALWIEVPTLLTSPQTQTAEAGATVSLTAQATSSLPLFYLWYFNGTNFLSSSTNGALELPNVQFAQAGVYCVVMSNALGAVTSAPAMLDVIAPVERRLIPGVNVTGEAASLLNVDYADSLSPVPNWIALGSVSLTATSQYWFDLTQPLPPQRFYRASQAAPTSVMPTLDLHLIPALTLIGAVGSKLQVDSINQFGPTDAWFPLDTVTLTNTSQLYFDVSVIGQPPRLWRLIQVP